MFWLQHYSIHRRIKLSRKLNSEHILLKIVPWNNNAWAKQVTASRCYVKARDFAVDRTSLFYRNCINFSGYMPCPYSIACINYVMGTYNLSPWLSKCIIGLCTSIASITQHTVLWRDWAIAKQQTYIQGRGCWPFAVSMTSRGCMLWVLFIYLFICRFGEMSSQTLVTWEKWFLLFLKRQAMSLKYKK